MLLGFYLPVLFLCFMVLNSANIFYRYILTPYKLHTQKISFAELMVILNTAIETQLQLYENDIFEIKGAITNSNFENYYRDLVDTIIASLSPDFMKHMSFYMREDQIITLICRTVKEFLAQKVNGPI